MVENIEIENVIESSKLESSELLEPDLKLIYNFIQIFAPEIGFLYNIKEDESEEQQIKTGQLQENRILGIMLKFYLEGKKKISTAEIEQEYKKYFKDIARSTISTYLNILNKESTLYKERDGRIVYYILYLEPPKGISPFWFTRIFCIIPAYFNRALYFTKIYVNTEKYILDFIHERGRLDRDILIRNFKFITGIILLKIFKNRSSKCKLCQFSNKEIYSFLEESMSKAIKDRSDLLSEDLLENLIEKYSEIAIFDGIDINEDLIKENVVKEIMRCADIYKKDLDFQIMISHRRKDLNLKRKITLEEENINKTNKTTI